MTGFQRSADFVDTCFRRYDGGRREVSRREVGETEMIQQSAQELTQA
jgi:hypothetical protein